MKILTVHAQSFRGGRDLAFCLKVPLDSLLIERAAEILARRRIARTFAARIGGNYQIRLTRPINDVNIFLQTNNIEIE